MKYFFTLLIIFSFGNSIDAQNSIIIHADQGKDTISRHIYGHFSEHLCRCIYGGFFDGESPMADLRRKNGRDKP